MLDFSFGGTILFSWPFLAPFLYAEGRGEGTCCSDHKMPVVAYGVKNYHACLDLDPLKCSMQLSVKKAQ